MVQTLAKMERRTMSAMSAELIEAALNLPKYRSLLEEAAAEGRSFKPKQDPRTRGKKERPRYVDMLDEQQAKAVEDYGLDKVKPENIQGLIKLLSMVAEENDSKV